ncbi:uncharacterized protein Z519_04278 [Cladophialophora bantiana CBS 173.52]|uniref:Uncharacterized protein n=1 Tax=Cladophialophora bantiana (strain ATCC 10958 / CBS 173.52 / CDC B-1940 / NIH 8579) TaxID=1442370 RepID=A0A0D2HQG9_CLAB1|nr:uncharacterized protein Z519_04278 [Cladophialophora bantiana CBS 173.52]KIW95693.1 hypothetical protein Z519_04278 [Cladophialophora bantiana CBS 173.52]
MSPRTRAAQAYKPALASVQFIQAGARQTTRRAYAVKAAPTRPGAPRDMSSSIPLTKPSVSGNAEMTQARRQGDPANEYRDPRDSPAKTLEQKKAKRG